MGALTLLPALDVSHGRVARSPEASDSGQEGAEEPLVVARRWMGDGARWIHVVDLDAAFARGSNADVLASIVGDAAGRAVRVEWSGGVVDTDALDRALASGCDRAVVSTSALDGSGWLDDAAAEYGERVAVALDVRTDGRGRWHLAARGGGGRSDDLLDTIERLDRAGCRRYVITDVDRDGALSGPDLTLLRTVLGATGSAVIASGGVASLDHLRALAALDVGGSVLDGVVVGNALHARRFSLPDALDAVR